MRGEELERRLREAADHAAPNNLEAILNAPRREPEEILLVEKRRRHWLPMAAAALLALMAFCGFQTWRNGHMVASVVCLDVNPSIQIQVNRKTQVLAAEPLNKEAWEVLDGMELKGAQLNVAVNAIVGSLLQHGYFNDAGSSILISVEDRDPQRAQRLESTLNESVGAALENTVVHSQVVAYDAGTESSASGVSAGKAALIRDIQGLNSGLDFADLSALTVEELWQLRQSGASGMPVGLSNAAYAAEAYAGTLELNSTTWEGEPELDETPAHYDIELSVYGMGKFEYKVDAYTGEVLEGIPNVLRISMPLPSVPETTPAPSAPETAPAPSISIPAPSAAGSSYIGEESAKSIAYAHAGVQAADVYSLELELDDGVYELEFRAGTTKYKYEINARDGSILKAKTDGDDSAYSSYSGHHDSHHTSDSCITEEAARTAALQHAGVSLENASGYRCHTDWDDGWCRYEIEFRYGGVEYEYEIDGRTGAVLKAEQER